MTLCSVSPDPTINRLVEHCGYATAALTILPIPGSEIIGVMPLHVGMVIGIANHYDRSLTEESAMELVLQIGATVGFSLVGSRLATTAAKIILPGLGGVVAAPFMYASTLGLGAVADGYFRMGPLSEAQMKDLYRQAKSEAKRGFDPGKAREDDAMNTAREAVKEDKPATPEDPVARLKKAKGLLDQELISQEEYDAVKARILDAL